MFGLNDRRARIHIYGYFTSLYLLWLVVMYQFSVWIELTNASQCCAHMNKKVNSCACVRACVFVRIIYRIIGFAFIKRTFLHRCLHQQFNTIDVQNHILNWKKKNAPSVKLIIEFYIQSGTRRQFATDHFNYSVFNSFFEVYLFTSNACRKKLWGEGTGFAAQNAHSLHIGQETLLFPL